jgi:hypothetical protein
MEQGMTPEQRLLWPRSRNGLWMVAAAALLLAGGGWAGLESQRLYEQVAAQQNQIERLRVATRRPPPPKMTKEERERAKRWAALQAEREFRWYPVFRDLEGASSEDIELLEFSPDKRGATFVLRGEARDTAALLDYLSALAGQRSFADVYLAQQKVVRRDQLVVQGFELHGRLR